MYVILARLQKKRRDEGKKETQLTYFINILSLVGNNITSKQPVARNSWTIYVFPPNYSILPT